MVWVREGSLFRVCDSFFDSESSGIGIGVSYLVEKNYGWVECGGIVNMVNFVFEEYRKKYVENIENFIKDLL